MTKNARHAQDDLEIVDGFDWIDASRRLFQAYVDEAVALHPDIRPAILNQGWQEELDTLEEKYGPPLGRILLARKDGESLGCVALRDLGDGIGEMKRYYVIPEARGQKVGSLLLNTLFSVAKDLGYQKIRLDTFSAMEGALGVYEAYGFKEIHAYNDNLADSAVFLEKDLAASEKL